MKSLLQFADDACTALINWLDEVGRRRGQAALNRYFASTDDFDELTDTYPDAKRAD